MTQDALQVWTDFCRANQVAETTALKWGNIIGSKYGEAHRFYHTLDHISRMLELLKQHNITPNCAKYQILILSIFFHDIIYDPKSKSNELDSMQEFEKFVQDVPNAFDDEVVAKTKSCIKDTIAHQPTIEGFEIFLDFDLEILSAGKADYANYAMNIKKEYHFVNDYSLQRTKVMQNFLKRDKIYFDSDFAKSLNVDLIEREKAARLNIAREIRELNI